MLSQLLLISEITVDRIVVTISRYQCYFCDLIKPLFVHLFRIVKHYDSLSADAIQITLVLCQLCCRCIVTDPALFLSEIKGRCLRFPSDISALIIVIKIIIPHIYRSMCQKGSRCCIFANFRCFRILIFAQTDDLCFSIFSCHGKNRRV